MVKKKRTQRLAMGGYTSRYLRWIYRSCLAIMSALLWSQPAGASGPGWMCPAGETGVSQSAENPQVWIEKPTVELLAGTSFELRIHAGTEQAPVRSLFGLSFELHYSSDDFIEFLPPVQAQAGDFLQPNVYTFTRYEKNQKVLYLAVSRKRGAAGQSGHGVVLSLPMRFADNAPPGWEVCFKIASVTANDSAGTRLAVDPGPTRCIHVLEPHIDVIPNPFTPNGDGFNDRIRFKRDGGIPDPWVILIMDRTGRLIRRFTHGQDTWDGRDEKGRPMLPGVYLYHIRDGNRTVRRGLIGLIR